MCLFFLLAALGYGRLETLSKNSLNLLANIYSLGRDNFD